MTYDTILYEIIDDVAVISLNEPSTLNAMHEGMGKEILHALLRGEKEARAILLGATGNHFCAGAKLGADYINIDDPDIDMGGRLDGIFNPIIYQMRAAETPIVTAVKGAAAGVGCAIALAGDLIVAGENASFFQAFSKIGLAPDGGSSYLLTKAIGRPRAMEMMLLGPKLKAAKALEWGLINRVEADEDVHEKALALAKTLAHGPKSLGIIKKAAWAALDSSFETTLSNERVGQRKAGRTEDFAEGVAAFREKRTPHFKGK